MAFLDNLVSAVDKPDGGFTYHMMFGDQPKSGYAVSVYKGQETVLPRATLKRADLARFVVRNWDMLKERGNYFGAWHNPADGKIYLDVSRVVSSRAEAERLGREHNQIAYFDLAKGESVPVPATAPKEKFAGVHKTGTAADARSPGASGHHRTHDGLVCYWKNGARHCFVPDDAKGAA